MYSARHFLLQELYDPSIWGAESFYDSLAKLQKEEIISIAIDSCVRNATLSYGVVMSSLDVPSYMYAAIPSNAQVFFTTAPIMITWLVWQVGRRLYTSFQKRKRATGIANQRPVVQAFAVKKEEVPMVRVSNIKEAWTNQDLRPLWC